MSARPASELDAEQEVDLGRYASAIAARWWLPLLGLVIGILLGYLASIGGRDVYRAQALVYLGVPLSPGGGVAPSLATNPATVRELVRSEPVVRRVARETGLRPAQLRSGTTVQPAAGNVRTQQPSLVNVGVQGDAPGKVAAAANALARIVVSQTSGYVNAKIGALEAQVEQARSELASIDRRVAATEARLRAGGGDQLELLTLLGIWEQRRTTVQQDMLDRQQLLSFARNEERGRVLERAVARKTTAQSRRNSLVVAGAIGLLLGLIAALAWESLARRLPARPA